uniref:Ovule protein n=1 Tax=Echinococcus granulosus TaxID=6210 RepID=A0A068WFE8_ECHGR|nr:hypothetical protein EgrG_000880100 [Echinococcus granulosus]
MTSGCELTYTLKKRKSVFVTYQVLLQGWSKEDPNTTPQLFIQFPRLGKMNSENIMDSDIRPVHSLVKQTKGH